MCSLYSLDTELTSLCIDKLFYEEPIDIYNHLKFVLRCKHFDLPTQIFSEMTDFLASSSLNLYSLWTEEYASIVDLHVNDIYLERETAELEFDCEILTCFESQCMDRYRKSRGICNYWHVWIVLGMLPKSLNTCHWIKGVTLIYKI